MRRWIVLFLLAGWPAMAFSESSQKVITIMTHESFSVSKEIVAEFEARNAVTLRFLKAGDAGAALNQAILSKAHPMADVFFGVDNALMGRALKSGIFVPYASPHLADIPVSLKLDGENRLLPVDYGDVCINYDPEWFQRRHLAPPKTIDDLILPAYAGLCVVEHPASSSPGLAFLLTTIGRYGETGFVEYWKKLQASKVLVVDGWKEAYWGNFSAASKGNRPIVVSYATSPAAEVYFSKKEMDKAPTAAVTAPGCAFRQIEFVGILSGTSQKALAEQVVDFFLSLRFQDGIPLQMFMYPARKSAKLPELFVKHAAAAEKPVDIPWEKIEANRELWLDRWADAALR
ncbi:thiamine ABC transporter substrate-binding protein [Desulfatirhabdium butyrativorans]|uniref:thiamine ABC transporter substrate-binding protein n=1 Tax=Desulfatirhabdium butyrativorans TaxID=340467 RepID=UPI00054D8AD7|nr:thiamine ABC transporter substrate-binding protein [Desulfatirhabdium butyrativorans]